MANIARDGGKSKDYQKTPPAHPAMQHTVKPGTTAVGKSRTESHRAVVGSDPTEAPGIEKSLYNEACPEPNPGMARADMRDAHFGDSTRAHPNQHADNNATAEKIFEEATLYALPRRKK